MQIVIDIPNELYNSVLNETYCGNLYEELKNGIVLPKGHGRLIDCDELKEQIRRSLAIKSFDYLLPAEKAIVEQIGHSTTIIPADKEDNE